MREVTRNPMEIGHLLNRKGDGNGGEGAFYR